MEGGSGDDWIRSYQALRKLLVEKGERGCLFTRAYPGNHHTLNLAIVSPDGESLTQVLIGAAVEKVSQ